MIESAADPDIERQIKEHRRRLERLLVWEPRVRQAPMYIALPVFAAVGVYGLVYADRDSYFGLLSFLSLLFALLLRSASGRFTLLIERELEALERLGDERARDEVMAIFDEREKQ